MKVHHISDTHQYHSQLNISPETEIVIHSGDATNNHDLFQNEIEMWKFIDWYKTLPIKHKIYVAGNHDGSLFHGRIRKQDFTDNSIIYLEGEEITIDGIKFYGQPYTPTFNDWYFMRKREKMHDIWNAMPADIDVLISHGAPKGILDLTENRKHEFEQCGDTALYKNIIKSRIKYCLFGHIHDNGDTCHNSGTMLHRGILFSNASAVKDGHFGESIFNGNRFNITKQI